MEIHGVHNIVDILLTRRSLLSHPHALLTTIVYQIWLSRMLTNNKIKNKHISKVFLTCLIIPDVGLLYRYPS